MDSDFVINHTSLPLPPVTDVEFYNTGRNEGTSDPKPTPNFKIQNRTQYILPTKNLKVSLSSLVSEIRETI